MRLTTGPRSEIAGIQELTEGLGVDFTIETPASSKELRQAVDSLNHGDTCGHIGAGNRYGGLLEDARPAVRA